MRIFHRDYAMAKQHRSGTHRVRSPAETLRAFTPLMPRLGITRLSNVTGLDRVGIPVWAAIRPNARLLAVAQGKGLDHDAAKASALMESIEHWHAEHLPPPGREASIAALRRTSPILDVDHQDGREPTLGDEEAIGWHEGYDLLAEQRIWVPSDAVDLDSVRPRKRGFAAAGNGLASGNHLLEAIVHGLCELIERDATALWFLAHEEDEKLVQVDLVTVDDAGCRLVIDALARADLVAGAYDVTSDIGIPTYACIVADRPGTLHAMGHFWGFGCHLSPAVALCRAMTEAVQCRLTEISGARDDIFADAYGKNRDEDELHDVALMVEGAPAPLRFDARASLASDTFEDDLALLLARLRRVGLESAAVVDLTRPDVAVPVVQVLVPGLEGFFSPGKSPGRRARAYLAARAGNPRGGDRTPLVSS